MTINADSPSQNLTGLSGWVAGVIESLGEVGVGLLVALENIIPPIPSEVVLALAGYLANQGSVNLVLVWVAATLGSLIGAIALYWVGRGLGEERLKRWLDKVPLVERDDLEKADRWFEKHGKWAVLLGRCVPVVRSLVSLPAGANHMPVPMFTAFTALGSGVWNTIFIGAGYALGSRWQDIEQYNRWFDYIIWAIFAWIIGSWVFNRVRARRRKRARQH
ncbi:membrane protein DedA with SNARE-associated domain [Catenuloplanes nepalensis]|uniref:Membrane protein DedA with SNARE-associated domain n=1 Tax=Catenuloplanes nepalensis TaxID=587533 RepID=A0ABT9N1F4_9ACTN|nr:DedA family protein [Catenuloplanes nepalensis]MDP9797519.1 membrane protein DedA with SNARE-associated domain [Catenuloplanes nepalensis]